MALGFRGFNRGASSVQKTLVTYNVDTGTSYQEKVKKGDTVLSPTSFTPTKTGYTFLGWREDTTATSSVLSTKTAEGKTMTLYAVFYKVITLSYNGNGNTGGSTNAQSDNSYYNNANSTSVTFTVRSNGFTKTNYSFYVWRLSSTSGTRYREGSSITLSNSATMYVEWIVNSLVIINGGTITQAAYVSGTVNVYASCSAWDLASKTGTFTFSKGSYQTVSLQMACYINPSASAGLNDIADAYFDGSDFVGWMSQNTTKTSDRGNVAAGSHTIRLDVQSFFDSGVSGYAYVNALVLSNPSKY